MCSWCWAFRPTWNSVLAQLPERDEFTGTRRHGDFFTVLEEIGELHELNLEIVGHITEQELLRLLTSVDAANGVGNRHLMACVKRSQLLPHGGNLDEKAFYALAKRIAIVAAAARRRELVVRSAKANALWADVYAELSAEFPGIFGALIARSASSGQRRKRTSYSPSL